MIPTIPCLRQRLSHVSSLYGAQQPEHLWEGQGALDRLLKVGRKQTGYYQYGFLTGPIMDDNIPSTTHQMTFPA